MRIWLDRALLWLARGLHLAAEALCDLVEDDRRDIEGRPGG